MDLLNNETVKTSAPRYGYGTSKRPDGPGGKKNSKLLSPGPGSYSHLPKVGNE